MSVRVMGGVWQCGPQEQMAMLVLLAIADQADDFGVTVIAHETIALKARCSVRTVIRQIDELETEGWMKVGRKLWNGKANVYFVDLGKIGVRVSPDATLSPMHSMLRRSHGDTVSRIFAPEKSSDTDEISGDNPQPPQVTKKGVQVTKQGGSGDTSVTQSVVSLPVEEPLSKVEPTPPTPPMGGEETDDGEQATPAAPPVLPPGLPPEVQPRWTEAGAGSQRAWSRVLQALKLDLGAMPVSHPNFMPIRPDRTDWEACFAFLALRGTYTETQFPTATVVFLMRLGTAVPGADADATREGMHRYARRLEALTREYFRVPTGRMIRFELEVDVGAAEHPSLTPAA